MSDVGPKPMAKLRSMTGFGRASEKTQSIEVSCQIRTLNHRGLDLKFRLPQGLVAMESKLMQIAQAQLSRGRADIHFEVSSDEHENQKIKFETKKAKDLLKQLLDFQKKNKIIQQGLTMGDLLQVKELLSFKVSSETKGLTQVAKNVLVSALKDAINTREEEGGRLQAFMKESLTVCEVLIKKISIQLHLSSSEYYENLRRRMSELMGSVVLDDARMLQELAHIVQRADVTEELQRLLVHVAHFRNLCLQGGPIGRKLDFLCQEMFREANTASSKILEPLVTLMVVELKSEIERIREQVQNIE